MREGRVWKSEGKTKCGDRSVREDESVGIIKVMEMCEGGKV